MGTSSAVSEKEAESSISKVIPTTSSSVVSDRIPEKTREIPSRNNSVASIEQLPSSTLSFPSASLGGAAATLKHGVMSLIENPSNPSVTKFASLPAPPLMPQQQLVSQHQHVPIQQLISHHSASTASSHLPSRQVVSASLSSKVCMHSLISYISTYLNPRPSFLSTNVLEFLIWLNVFTAAHLGN